MNSVARNILEHVRQLPEGSVLGAKGLLHLGSRAAIDQALSRLARSGLLLRASRGSYLLPVEGRFGSRPPSVAKVVERLSEAEGAAIVPNGAAAANSLGLSTQVPVRAVYLTSGRSRKLRLGAQTIELVHAPRWQLAMAGRPAGEALRALAWLGRSQAARVVGELRGRLPPSEFAALSSAARIMPSWMAAAVSGMSVHG